MPANSLELRQWMTSPYLISYFSLPAPDFVAPVFCPRIVPNLEDWKTPANTFRIDYRRFVEHCGA
jgi:hypothetical protein